MHMRVKLVAILFLLCYSNVIAQLSEKQIAMEVDLYMYALRTQDVSIPIFDITKFADRALPYTIKYINSDNFYIKNKIIVLAREAKTPLALSVITALVNDKDFSISFEAVTAIYKEFNKEDICLYGGIQLRDSLIHFVNIYQDDIGYSLIPLGYYSGDKIAQTFLHQYQKEYGEDLISSIALYCSGDTIGKDQLLQILREENVEKIVFILNTLKYNNDIDVLSAISTLLNDKRPVTQQKDSINNYRICDLTANYLTDTMNGTLDIDIMIHEQIKQYTDIELHEKAISINNYIEKLKNSKNITP